MQLVLAPPDVLLEGLVRRPVGPVVLLLVLLLGEAVADRLAQLLELVYDLQPLLRGRRASALRGQFKRKISPFIWFKNGLSSSFDSLSKLTPLIYSSVWSILGAKLK